MLQTKGVINYKDIYANITVLQICISIMQEIVLLHPLDIAVTKQEILSTNHNTCGDSMIRVYKSYVNCYSYSFNKINLILL